MEDEHANIDAEDLGRVLAMIRDCPAWWAAKCCLIFMAFTGVRGHEARGATWEEVDLDKAEWTIPANRRKSGIPHRVPLSTHAVDLLDYVQKQGGGEGLIFPSRRGGTVMGSGVISSVLRRLEIRAVPHQLRVSFRKWLVGREDVPVEVYESLLALGRQYGLRLVPTDFYEQRQRVIQEWADFLSQSMGPVVPDSP